MRLRAPKPLLAGLIAMAVVCEVTPSPAQIVTRSLVDIEDCHFELDELVCSYDRPTYEIVLPDRRAQDGPIPVAMVLHDAARSGAELLANAPVVGPLLEAGFAVVAPDAEFRRNRRLIPSDWRRERVGHIEGDLIPAAYSEKKFLVEDPPGELRRLAFGRDRGWYFETTDRIIYADRTMGDAEDGGGYDYIGRDEIAALRLVLDRAAVQHGTARRPTIVIGFGHGGSLVWQIACRAPRMADLLAPVGGAFWQELPVGCAPGARLIHTHARESLFWPLEGRGGGKHRYRRIAIKENVAVMVEANDCLTGGRAETRLAGGADLATWTACLPGTRVEVMLLDERFAFQDWWMAELLARVGRAPAQPEAAEAAEAEEPAASGPVFRQPGSDRGGLFKRP